MTRSLSLQQRLALGLSTVVVGLVVLIAVVVRYEGHRAARTSNDERLVREATEIAELTARGAATVAATAERRAADPAIAEAIAQPTDAHAMAARAVLLQPTTQRLIGSELWDARGGRILATTPGLPIVDDALVRQVLTTAAPSRRAVVSPIVAADSIAAFAVIAPIGAEPHVGFVVDWYPAVGEASDLLRSIAGENTTLVIGNADGTRWADLDSRPTDAPPPGGTTGREYRRGAAAPVIGIARPIPGTPWRLALESPRDVVYRRVDQVILRLGQAGFAVLVLALLVAFAMARTLARPLRELAAAADAIGHGDADVRIAVTRDDEFGAVGNAFNQMSERLAAARVELDAKVEALAAAEARYHGLFDASPHATYVYDGETTQMVDVNATALARYGYTRDEFLALTLPALRPPEDRDELQRLASVSEGETRSYIARHMTKDGRVFDVELTATAIQFNGRLARLVMATDLTERRRVEESLHRVQDRFKRALASSGAVIYELEMVGAEPLVAWMSESTLPVLGYTTEEAAAPLWWSHRVHPDDLARLMARSPSERLSETPHQYRFRHKDGRYRWLRDEQRILRHADGEPRSVIGALIDVTATHDLQEQLSQAQKVEAVGRLAGGVAHDFNNLLTVILGEVTLLRREPEAGLPTLEPSIANIEAAAERATHLTRQLLTFARRQLVELVPRNLNEVLRELTSMVDRMLGEDVTFTARLADDLGLILADRGQIEQVIVNLVVNARDAMPRGGTVTVETHNVEIDDAFAAARPGLPAGPAVRLSIADTGSGLSAEAKAHLFEPFFTTKAPGKGTGLGLATCYAIVRQHNGHIELFSEAGAGTTVHVYLPRIAHRDRRHSPRGRAAIGGDETILYVEDDASVRTIAVRLLRALGYTVLEAGDGAAALALLDSYPHEVHLLLTDVVMPQMGGRALAEHVHALRPGMHILFASGYSDDEILNRQLLDRDVVLLQKPFSIDALAAKVREALTRS